MIKAGIIGASGYAGSELLRLLSSHKDVKIAQITSQSYEGKPFGQVYENYRHRPELICEGEDINAMAEVCDVIFMALPHGIASGKVTKEILDKAVVIDLGADYRLSDYHTYEQWYGTEHVSKDLLKEAVYGLCEVHRDKIKDSRLIANPGCYTSCSILSLYPLLKEGIIEPDSIIIDAKSGVSGAGRGVNLGVHFCETNESFKPYKVAAHRHTPEIEEQLSLAAGQELYVQFTPHLIPANRCILATCYGKLKDSGITYDSIMDIYKKYYGGEYFIRLTQKGVLPETKWVKGSNFTDIGFTIDRRTGRIIVIGALDNLVKGAAGQAVQNMNIVFGLDEKEGLDYIPVFPA